MLSTSLKFSVDDTRCIRCSLCVSDCPSGIINRSGAGCPSVAPQAEASCISCQHCLAVCPQAAISIQGLFPENSRPIVASALPNLDQMDLLLRARRSIRHYRDENVEPTLINRLLYAISCGPTGANRRELTFTVIQDKSVLADFKKRLLDGLAKALGSGHLPPQSETLARNILSAWDKKRDVVFRNAPHLLLVSAPASTPCPQQDVALTLAYFELLAQSAGLGTVWCGYLRILLERLPEYKQLLKLPSDHVYFPILFGHPAVAYARTVQREGSAKISTLQGF